MSAMATRTIVTAFASLMLVSSAFAQATAPAPTTPAPAPAAKTAPAPKAKAEHTAAALECSKQADAKGLHGKERKKFRSECKKGAAKAN